MVGWDGTRILTTPRLVLRTFRREDLPLYAALNADPEVARWLGGPLSREDSDDIAAWANELYAEEGIGLLAVERRADGAFLGMCGVHHQQSYPGELEVGWRLAHEHWGNGYATEAAMAWLDHAFGPLGADRVISITDRENVRSLAVMRRLGMTLDHAAEVRDGDEVFDAVIYAITRNGWLERRSDGASSPASGWAPRMDIRIQNVTVDAADPQALARFWAEAIGWRLTYEDADECALEPPIGDAAEGGPDILFIKVPDEKRVKNRMHFDLRPKDQDAEVERLLALGATHADIGQGDEVPWVVLADPESNEFCVLRPRPSSDA